jgi:hypothetical protein
VLRRAGDVYRGVGLARDAALLYEPRAATDPDDPEALMAFGGKALAAEGR